MMWNPFEIKTTFSGARTAKELDWEESALDSQSRVEGVHDQDRAAPTFRWLMLGLAVVFLALSGRIFFLQIVRGNDFRALSDNNRIRSQSILAPRGLILDNQGEVLAQNTASFNLVAVPFDLPKSNGDLSYEVETAAMAFSFDKEDLLNKIKAVPSQSIVPIVVVQDMPKEQAILFQTRASEFVGFSVQQIPVRDYIQPEVFSHVLGYAALVSEADLLHLDADKYDSIDFTGKTGLEAHYENYLHGVNGRDLVEVDATGKLLDVLGQSQPTPGFTLSLNIDKQLQEKLYSDLKKSDNTKAAAVAINPKTGQVLALVSLPGFNNNLFGRGISQKDYSQLLTDKNLPLFNRAITGTYPPGSTVKPMVGAAALEEGIVTASTVINDRGVLVIPNQFNPAIAYNFYGWNRAGLGPMNIYSAIAESSDIYFYTVAGGYPKSAVPEGLGAEKLAEYYRKFNLGKNTGVDVPGEKPGLVPDPAWKEAYFKDDAILSKWYLGDTYHIGIGQGDLLVTPLQVAEWTAIIANNGTGYVPTVVNKITDKNGNTILENVPRVLVENFLDHGNVKIVQDGMRQTVVAGSGRQLSGLPIEAAGKTGTSQFDGSDPSRTHAWFTAYAPFNDPQIVITVLVEAGGEGHSAAVPVVNNALKWWAENRYRK